MVKVGELCGFLPVHRPVLALLHNSLKEKKYGRRQGGQAYWHYHAERFGMKDDVDEVKFKDDSSKAHSKDQ